MKYIVYKTVKFILKPLFYILYRPTYICLDNIPTCGSVILAGNHTNILDAALMLAGPKRVVHMMAKKELFNNYFLRIFFKGMACISVNRQIHDQNAKNDAIKVLNDNEVLGIFPEGTINNTQETLLPFKYGAVSFAKKTNSYIVPFAITGKYKLFKKSVTIRYGKPYKVSDNLELENNRLMNKVKKLLEEV